MKVKAATTLILFGIFWSGIVLVFDRVVLFPIARQIAARNFPSTSGKIMESEVVAHTDSDATTYGIKVAYSYRVQDRNYVGERYSYDKASSSDNWASKIVRANPPGTQVRVFYNPRDPADAVLTVGIHGSDLLQLQFLTPFNLVMLGFWWAGLRKVSRAVFKQTKEGLAISTSLRRSRVRLAEIPIPAIPIGTFGIAAFLGLFIVIPFFGGFHPSLRTMHVSWLAIFSVTACVTAWYSIRVFAGNYDLVFDELGGFMEIPATNGRKSRRRLPLSTITAVNIQTLQNPSDSDEAVRRFAVDLEIADGTPHTERLFVWHDLEKSSKLADWVHSKLPVQR